MREKNLKNQLLEYQKDGLDVSYFIKLLSRKEEAKEQLIRQNEQIAMLINPVKTKDCFTNASKRGPEKKTNATQIIKNSDQLLQQFPVFTSIRGDDEDLEPVDLLQETFHKNVDKIF